ncbi:MAG: gamma-glutamylcyclotransferase [Rivularia sp. (in: Bacteria)]|nr:gamma-glutamylcyclotransferase [Rivularia sp. MS3]
MSLTRADLESSRLHNMISQSGLGMQLLSESQLQESIRLTLNSHKSSSDVWLFAYGSLIWNPIFKYTERRVGTIYGWHRRFCLRAPVGRGTPENPGLVLGLDCGGSCRGVVYRIAEKDVRSELSLLWRREMVIGSYIPKWVKVVDGTDEVMAIAFIINRHHPDYAGKITFEKTVNIIATAAGELGSSAEYLIQTVEGLKTVGIEDKQLLQLRSSVLEQQQSN